ncbi:hypothetical protein K3495_g12432 [Podosphaera aphanis]|nr:hypothetical protein K3495_g12432 [Podosphaera aphanis]
MSLTTLSEVALRVKSRTAKLPSIPEENMRKLISSPLLIDCLINNSFYVKAMVDTGCLCFSIFDQSLVRKHKFYSENIAPRSLRLADGKATININQVARINMDIDGRREMIWGYVMPNLAYPIILGKPWMEYNNVIYSAKRKCLRIGSRKYGMIVRASDWYEQGSPTAVQKRISHVSLNQVAVDSGIVFAERLKRARESKDITLGAISINDINRALEPKKSVSKEEVQRGLPEEIRSFTDLFLDDDVHRDSALPPHRPGVDTNIRLQQDDRGRDKEVPWGPLYGMSRDELLVLRKTLTELLDKSWIRASSSPGGAPVLFIRKPNGGLRFCVDYRALNAITKRDRYPLPLIRETLRLISNAAWVSKVDVRAAFHRLRVAKGDEWKTAFRTRFGSYEWLVTPFGLAGAPAAFQRWINQVLGDLLGNTCAAYLDDIIIFSDGDLADHWVKVQQVLKRLRDAGLRLDPQKCEFASKEIKYLGFIISVKEGIKVDPDKVKAISTWEVPKNVKGVRSFLGFANFYRGFVKNFAEISNPLLNLFYLVCVGAMCDCTQEDGRQLLRSVCRVKYVFK